MRKVAEHIYERALPMIPVGYTPEVQTWHGSRATVRTMLAERLDVDPLVIEAQLAHAVKDANGRAYNRTQYMAHRARMMQRWADFLDELRSDKALDPTPQVEVRLSEVKAKTGRVVLTSSRAVAA